MKRYRHVQFLLFLTASAAAANLIHHDLVQTRSTSQVPVNEKGAGIAEKVDVAPRAALVDEVEHGVRPVVAMLLSLDDRSADASAETPAEVKRFFKQAVLARRFTRAYSENAENIDGLAPTHPYNQALAIRRDDQHVLDELAHLEVSNKVGERVAYYQANQGGPGNHVLREFMAEHQAMAKLKSRTIADMVRADLDDFLSRDRLRAQEKELDERFRAFVRFGEKYEVRVKPEIVRLQTEAKQIRDSIADLHPDRPNDAAKRIEALHKVLTLLDRIQHDHAFLAAKDKVVTWVRAIDIKHQKLDDKVLVLRGREEKKEEVSKKKVHLIVGGERTTLFHLYPDDEIKLKSDQRDIQIQFEDGSKGVATQHIRSTKRTDDARDFNRVLAGLEGNLHSYRAMRMTFADLHTYGKELLGKATSDHLHRVMSALKQMEHWDR